jgi:hypothetical protein
MATGVNCMAVVKATETQMDWSPELPVFASGRFLDAVGDRFGWIGGFDENGARRCILPYTLIRGPGVVMARFRVETIPLCEDFEIEEERTFLAESMEHLRSVGADVVIPATTNTVFRTYPHGADAAPYGSYIVDLSLAEADLWRNIERITRQNINTAKNCGILIRDGVGRLDQVHRLIQDTFTRSRLPFMSYGSLQRFVGGLGENARVLVAEHEDRIESCVVYAFSRYCAYAVYGGNRADQKQGANKLLHWEAMKIFRQSSIRQYDFVGARIDPEKGSKQDAINSFKRHLGGELRRGYIWKYPLRPVKARVYNVGVRLLRGGDIVDLEQHKMTQNGGQS